MGAGRRRSGSRSPCGQQRQGGWGVKGERGVVTPPPSRLGRADIRPRSSREVGKVWACACSWKDKDSLTLCGLGGPQWHF